MTTVNFRHLMAALVVLSVAACQSRGNVEMSHASGTHGVTNQASSRGVVSATPQSGSAQADLLTRDKFDPDLLAKASISTGKRYFIDFRSRFALSYGHTFVVFGQVDSRGREVNAEVAGLAPKSDNPAMFTVGHFVPVESSTGWTDGDSEYEYMTAIWRVMLTKSEYDKVVADIRELQESSPVWHAVFYNCNAFVGAIASSMGYSASFHWLSPKAYITNLRKANGGPDAIGWTTPTVGKAPGVG